MPGDLYQGPIIDAHHHLWDISLGRHPWLTRDDESIKALGDISFMRKTYMIEDYLADVGPQKLVGSVYIEAVWDRTRDPVEETQWLETLDKSRGIAARYIVHAPLTSPGVESVLERQAAFPRVIGVRETIRWHPDPAKRWTEAGIIDNPDWRRGFSLLRRYGLALELLMNPYQAGEVARLAREFPEQIFIVNHCGTPVDRDEEGLARWRSGLRLMGEAPNIAIKLSNFGAYAANRSIEGLSRTVLDCIDAFGTERAMFGTDYPVARRSMAYQEICESFKAIISRLSPTEQRALFHDNARRSYRFD
jgi:predicted TIM-barrel fold metal-dependent hydrolase